ncbi:transcriptional adapter 1 isoform X3 [Empidonax traillii]|uniref:transcriptional adapter 1 isoform X3 n=1 Tax=Empidonax traillii TaxID=164674 RepID=UPI000FFD353E|nr:transcriptional adapter 1 isoform X3 [Empidonax traillii]
MATYVSELEAAKKSLSEALGENVKQYWANLKLWFKQKISKEEFDLEARRLLTQDNVHSHNDFLLAILTRCQILVSAPEGAGSLPWPGGSATKPGKPKGKKKISSVRQKFDHRFQPQNPLSGAQQFVAKDPQEDDDLKLCSHTMMLPTRGQLEGRMIVTAYEHGLDNVTEEAVTAVVFAVEAQVSGLAVKRQDWVIPAGEAPVGLGHQCCIAWPVPGMIQPLLGALVCEWFSARGMWRPTQIPSLGVRPKLRSCLLVSSDGCFFSTFQATEQA